MVVFGVCLGVWVLLFWIVVGMGLVICLRFTGLFVLLFVYCLGGELLVFVF